LLKSFVKRKRLDVQVVPANFDTVKTIYSNVRISIDPTWAKVEQFTALPERETFWKRLRGTMGKNLKFNPEEISDSTMRYETVWIPITQ
jgi:hypothetical protein